MQIRVINEDFPQTVFRQDHERSDGLHLSQIIRGLDFDFNPATYNAGNTWDLNSAAQIGVFWEEALSYAYAKTFAADIGEIEKDGIYMTPDGLNCDDNGLIVEEYKAAWTSSKKKPWEVFRYRVQLQCYCHTLEIPRGMWRVLYVNGNYKGSGPQYRVYEVEWDERELEECWEMVVNYAKSKGWL